MDVNIGKLCMCEETDIESVLAAMNTTAFNSIQFNFIC